MRIISCLSALCLLCAPAAGFAGTVILNGLDSTKVVESNGGASIRGAYSLENAGDEVILGVTVTIQIGSWKWAGEPTTLEVKAKKEWAIAEEIPSAKLSCAEDDLCAGLDLPQRGIFPKLTARQYQDLNRYPFAFIETGVEQIGTLSPSELGQLYSAPLTATMEVNRGSRDFSGKLRILNASSQAREVAVSFATSKQFKLESKPRALKIGPQQTANISFSVENFNAIPPSTHPMFAVLQWKEGDARMTALGRAELVVEKPTYNSLLIWGCAIVLMGSLLLLGAAQRRRKSKEPSA